MQSSNTLQSGRQRYIFNVDLMIESDSNALALEQLISALNRSGFIDYRIVSGIEVGKMIQQTIREPLPLQPVAIPPAMQSGSKAQTSASAGKAAKKTSAASQAQPTPASSAEGIDKAIERIHEYIACNQLVRVTVNRGRGVKLSVPCRVLNVDETSYNVTVYHVDEKKVYTFGLIEIDDIEAG